MGFFQRANPNNVVRVNTPDGEDWIEVYGEFSKAQVNRVILASPRNSDDREGALTFVEKFFEIAVKGWSMTDDKGNPVEPTVKVYRELNNDAAKWIEEVLATHITNTISKAGEAAEGKPSE